MADPIHTHLSASPAERRPGHVANDNPPVDQAEREVRRYVGRWIPWATVYALGFLILWVTGLAASPAFYVWAIGWVLVWGVWVQVDYLRRHVWRRPGPDEREPPR